MGKCPKNNSDMSEEPGVSLKKLPLAKSGTVEHANKNGGCYMSIISH